MAEARYDGVAAIFVQFADPAMRARLFAHIERCLKPGGVLILQGYTPKQLDYKTGGPPFASHMYTEDLLREAFAALRSLALREYDRRTFMSKCLALFDIGPQAFVIGRGRSLHVAAVLGPGRRQRFCGHHRQRRAHA